MDIWGQKPAIFNTKNIPGHHVISRQYLPISINKYQVSPLAFMSRLKFNFPLQKQHHISKGVYLFKRSHPLIDGSHGCVGVAVAARSVSDFPVGQSLIGGPIGPGRNDTQNLQLELQSVVGRGGGQADAGHLFRRLDGQHAFTYQL